jgi:hypothetical protein
MTNGSSTSRPHKSSSVRFHQRPLEQPRAACSTFPKSQKATFRRHSGGIRSLHACASGAGRTGKRDEPRGIEPRGRERCGSAASRTSPTYDGHRACPWGAFVSAVPSACRGSRPAVILFIDQLRPRPSRPGNQALPYRQGRAGGGCR